LVTPEQTWETKLVTRNKPRRQNWLPGKNLGAKIGYPGTKLGAKIGYPGTKLGAKIGYPEQTWEPKFVTQKVSGKLIKSV